eukprot:CAMPEP_0198214630 /NCGR_PEP_ID=MMETSP1445-20131203/42874_1 /TAXON_ID=36898 /ORGANISM="Pyramimonas sp., Strain CCMP2087" /LENGTH=238 /DNA_ID=CAMNT_0043889903 /DNA_START=468 /DNA_END=1184 /DNA_ORIENTATION=-
MLDSLSATQKQQIDRFLDILLDVNKGMNLTAIRDKQEAYTRHVGDSLALLPILDASVQTAILKDPSQTPKIMDVGSGGGIPGIILAISRPEWQVTLLDTLGKRIDFVNEAAAALGLTNVVGLWARAEDAGKNLNGLKQREVYHVVTARAVAEMRVLAELCLPLARVDGFLVAYKGANPDEEIAAASMAITSMGGTLLRVVPVDSEAPGGSRTAVVIHKSAPTPSMYPRRAGLPNKRPL